MRHSEIRSSATVDTQTWLDLIVDELGPEAKKDFEKMIAGELIVSPDDAFGSCLTRQAVKLRRFELGFDRKVLASEPRIVTGLVNMSEAEKARLRDGNEVLQSIVLDDAQRDPQQTLSINLVRDGEEIAIDYLPRGESVGGYQWVRDEDVPDTDCQH